MRYLLAMACCLVGMTACGYGSPTSQSPLHQDVVLAPGQSAPIAAAAISLRFLGVGSESRCPADASCVHAGSARVDVQVTFVTGGAQIVGFDTGDPRPVRFGSLTLALVQLTPYPAGSQPINPVDYRATLRVTR